MAFASWNQQPVNESTLLHQEEIQNPTKALAKTFGYMAIGVGITGAVAVLLGFLFGRILGTADLDTFNTAAGVYIGILIASFIGMLIDSIVISAVVARGRTSVWPAYIVYTVLMGAFISAFLVIGIDFWTMGEALAIAMVAFGGMFLIGYFSKINLNPLGLVAIGLLFMTILFGSFWGIMFAATGAIAVFDLVFSLIVCGLFMIIAAVDAYNIKRILANGDATNNICLYCAYIMYCDFIVIFIRVLYILAKLKSR